jgi:hypothetical protein
MIALLGGWRRSLSLLLCHFCFIPERVFLKLVSVIT